MMLSLLSLLHGTDARMELVYFLVSVFTVLLPVTVFTTIAFFMVRAYRREKRASRANVEEIREGHA